MTAKSHALAGKNQRPELAAAINRFVNDADISHEIVVIAVSYIFIFFGAWNDGVLGLRVLQASRIAEAFMAAVLLFEVASRVFFTRTRSMSFWSIVLLDIVSVLTVFPSLQWFGFARAVRGLYASGRLIRLLDTLACKKKNAVFLTAIFPLVVPLVAALVFAIERSSRHTEIHNYPQALVLCFEFALSLGNVRPVSPWAMALCGALFLIGLVCIGVLTNALSARYQPETRLDT